MVEVQVREDHVGHLVGAHAARGERVREVTLRDVAGAQVGDDRVGELAGFEAACAERARDRIVRVGEVDRGRRVAAGNGLARARVDEHDAIRGADEEPAERALDEPVGVHHAGLVGHERRVRGRERPRPVQLAEDAAVEHRLDHDATDVHAGPGGGVPIVTTTSRMPSGPVRIAWSTPGITMQSPAATGWGPSWSIRSPLPSCTNTRSSASV